MVVILLLLHFCTMFVHKMKFYSLRLSLFHFHLFTLTLYLPHTNGTERNGSGKLFKTKANVCFKFDFSHANCLVAVGRWDSHLKYAHTHSYSFQRICHLLKYGHSFHRWIEVLECTNVFVRRSQCFHFMNIKINQNFNLCLL